ncbi:hypothetical protein PhCBS80983_g05256 [Powellomyces hirtus]|uniref:Tail specific protease domain-containing protein n=1 Tax=Powellomyces hirtus TaxID=109895 RepID=A0A507DUW6_9FUNG|nr:hypothetical protein PhCBS80983_g05256 [Powellomyces hirtus]
MLSLKSAATAAVLLLSTASTLAQEQTPTDYCTLAYQAQNTTGFADWKSAKGCLDMHGLDNEVRKSTIDTLEKSILGYYSFTDMAAVQSTIDGGAHDLVDVDLRKVLTEAKTKAYKNDRAFHDEMHRTIRKLGDAHSLYYHRCYHQAMAFVQPYDMRVLVNSETKKQEVFLDGPLSVNANYLKLVTEAMGGVDPKTYLGWKVKTIDGKDAVKWIEEYAFEYVGDEKDNQVRFNQVTAKYIVEPDGSVSYAAGKAKRGIYVEAPEKATRTLGLVGPDGKEVVVEAPWFAGKGSGVPAFTDAKSYYNNVCLAPPPALEARDAGGETHTKFLSLKELREEKLVDVPTVGLDVTNTTENYYGNGYPKMLVAGKYASFHLIDAETGVSALPVFDSGLTNADGSDNDGAECKARLNDPDATANIGTGGPAGPNFYCFIIEIHEGLKKLKEAGAKKIILDWTENGGGWGDLGFAHVAVMFPEVVRDVARFRMSPFFREVMQVAFTKDVDQYSPLTMFGPANFLDPKTEKNPTNADIDRLFLNENLPVQEYGGYKSVYSGLMNIVDGGGDFSTFGPHTVWNATGIPKPTEPLWPKENVLLLTNGLCGSTCAHAARLAVDHVGIRSVVKGGLAGGKPFAFSAFPGGNVLEAGQMFSDLKKIGLENHPLAPQPFKANLRAYRLNVGVGYSKREDLPAEYAYKAADCRMDITEKTFHPAGAWQGAAALFESCEGTVDVPPTSSTCTDEPTATATASVPAETSCTDEPTATATASVPAETSCTDEPTATATASETDAPVPTETTPTDEPTSTGTVSVPTETETDAPVPSPTDIETDVTPEPTETPCTTETDVTPEPTETSCTDEPTVTGTVSVPTETETDAPVPTPTDIETDVTPEPTETPCTSETDAPVPTATDIETVLPPTETDVESTETPCTTDIATAEPIPTETPCSTETEEESPETLTTIETETAAPVGIPTGLPSFTRKPTYTTFPVPDEVEPPISGASASVVAPAFAAIAAVAAAIIVM